MALMTVQLEIEKHIAAVQLRELNLADTWLKRAKSGH